MPANDNNNTQDPDDNPSSPPLVWCGLCGYQVASHCTDWNTCVNMRTKAVMAIQ